LDSLNSNMCLYYDNTLHGHLAEYMIYLSTAQSFWFSLNLSYDHDFHLSLRFGMTAHSYEFLLVAANTAHLAQFFAVTVTVAVVRAVAVLVGMRQRCAERRRRRWMGGDGVTRGDATTSRIKGARGVR
jgi:hypothetical protein